MEARSSSDRKISMRLGNFKYLMEDKRLGRAAKRMLFTIQTLPKFNKETKPVTYRYVANLVNMRVNSTKKLIKELVDAEYIKIRMIGVTRNARIVFIQPIDWFDIKKYENHNNGDGITVSISISDHDRLHQGEIRASASDFFVYVALSRWGREESYPSLKSISELISVSSKNVVRSARRLEKIGMLQVDRSKQEHNANVYKRSNTTNASESNTNKSRCYKIFLLMMILLDELQKESGVDLCAVDKCTNYLESIILDSLSR